MVGENVIEPPTVVPIVLLNLITKSSDFTNGIDAE